MTSIPVVIERHEDGFVAYPLGVKGVVVAEGDSEEEVLADLQSAIRFHIETFGEDVLPKTPPPMSVTLRDLPLNASQLGSPHHP